MIVLHAPRSSGVKMVHIGAHSLYKAIWNEQAF